MNIQSKKTGFAGGLLKLVAAATIVLGAVGVSQVAGAATLSIKDSRHNLGASGTGTNKLQTDAGLVGNTEICVFCHTPHASSQAASVPLWNKNINTVGANGAGSNGKTYKLYDSTQSSTIDGSVDLSGGVSLACLSCHDGTQAMNNMINKPGSDGYVAAGSNFGVMSGGNQIGGKLIGLANLGSNDLTANTTNPDLSNDHPIGIQYCGGGITASTTTCADSDFVAPTKKAGADIWWVESKASTGAGRQKNDIILYARSWVTGVDGSGNPVSSAVQPMVECASCHDPHQANNPTFLRLPNTNSDVCLSCHVK